MLAFLMFCGLIFVNGILSAGPLFSRHLNNEIDTYEATKQLHLAAEIKTRDTKHRHARNNCDSKSHLKNLQKAHDFRERILNKKLRENGLGALSVNKTGNADINNVRNRTKRWADYDPNYNWENGGKDYTLPGEEKRESDFEKYAKNWQKNTLKVIFTFSFVCMILCCCVACCKKIFERLWDVCCWHCRDWRDICLNRDPTYRRIRKFADDYGLNIDYEQYQKMKSNYEEALKKQGHEFVDLSGR